MKMRFPNEAADGLEHQRLVGSEADSFGTSPNWQAQPEHLPVERGRHASIARLTGPFADSPAVAACHTLQASLWLRYPENTANATVFVGAARRCGSSTVAAGFVEALSRDPVTRILLMDFRISKTRSSQAPMPKSDLRYLLDSSMEAPPSGMFPSNIHRLSIGSSGSIPPSLLQSTAFDDLLQTARERFDHVIIDAPPLQTNMESLVLSRKADGVVLVVHAGKTRKQTALWAKQQIENARGNLLGVVLNRRKHYVPRWLYEWL